MKMNPKYSEKYRERDKNRARGWLNNIVLDNFSSIEFEKMQNNFILEEHDQDNDHDNEYYIRRKDMLELIINVINNDFTNQQREVFLMFHQYGVKQPEIARVLKISQPHIAQCLKKCIKKIKNKLRDGEDICQTIKRINQERKKKILIKSLKMKREKRKQRLLKKQQKSRSMKTTLTKFFRPLLKKKSRKK